MKSGYLKLHRSFFSHWLWEDGRSFSKAEAFLDLLQLAAFVPTKRIVSGSLIELEQGELVASVRYLGARWTWGKDKVAEFMKMLESDNMIRRRSRQGETIIMLCNYKDYNQPAESESDSKTDAKQDRRQTVARQTPDKVEELEEGKEFKPYPASDEWDEWADTMPTSSAKLMESLQRRINGLHPSWTKRPHFSAKELHSLADNAKAWLSVDESDWKLLEAYMAARIPDEWKKDPRDFWQPDIRIALINAAPTLVLGNADKWQRVCIKHRIPTGLETQKTA